MMKITEERLRDSRQHVSLLIVIMPISIVTFIGYVYFTTPFVESGRLNEYVAMIGFSVLTAVFFIPIAILGILLVGKRQLATAGPRDRKARITLGLLVLFYVINTLIINIEMYI